MTAADTASPPLTRRLLPVVAAAVVLLALVVALGPSPTGPPLDPDSAADDGLLGLVRTLEALDVEVAVTTTPPASTAVRAFVPLDRLSEQARADWEAWVTAGGRLVVADPTSRFHDLRSVQPPLAELLGAADHRPDCAVLPDDLEMVRHDAWTGFDVEHLVDLPGGAAGGDAPAPADVTATCFPLDDAVWLVVRRHGDGELILLGAATPFTNRWLGEADNAVLAAALLGPSPDAEAVLVPRPPPDELDVTLLDLVPDGVWRALLLLALAALVAVLSRARRLGAPVEERLPPVVPSAELASSVADLTRRAGDRQGAAARLRAPARETVARSLGTGHDVAPADLAERLARTLHLDVEVVRRALVDAPVPDDEELLAVAASVAEVRDAAAVPAPPPRPPTDDPSPTRRSEP